MKVKVYENKDIIALMFNTDEGYQICLNWKDGGVNGTGSLTYKEAMKFLRKKKFKKIPKVDFEVD